MIIETKRQLLKDRRHQSEPEYVTISGTVKAQARGSVKEEKMKSKAEIAVEKFLEGYNCAQSVFYSFCFDLGFDRNLALKMASGFGGGMGLKEEVCGAVTGGIIVIGARLGRGENEGPEVTQTAYAKTQEFMDRFSEKHGTFICRELLGGCDFTTEEGRKHFKDNDLRIKTCKACVEDAVNILEAILY